MREASHIMSEARLHASSHGRAEACLQGHRRLCRQLEDTAAVGLLVGGIFVKGEEGDGTNVAHPVLTHCNII